MFAWSKYPFLKLLIPMALGIWFGTVFGFDAFTTQLTFGLSIALFCMAGMAVLLLKSFRFNWLFGGIIACYLFVMGMAMTQVHEISVKKNYFRNHETDAKYYVARIYEYPSERENSIKTVLELEYQFGDSLTSRPVTGKVMAYFQKTDSAFSLRYGDLIAINAPAGEVASPKNPGEFDYRAHLTRKGITGQCWLKDADWIDLQMNSANPLFALSYRFRDNLLRSLQRCGVKDKEFGVAAAILLGYDDSLADEVRKNYVAAGAMHILCVSGLHVGIIYMLASFLLGFLKRKKWQTVLKSILLLLLVWSYAFIAGLSPSILRATLMVSFVVIGEMIQRKGFVINSIAASAFILLCVNPNNLFEIGFQLSYVAVVGIVVLQRPIYHLLYLKNRLLDKAWEITAVALAAQAATMPFTLFYYQQFTTYFWLSNLFMTPISFFVVIGGMLLLVVSWIPYLNTALGYLVWGVLYVMNQLVSWIEGLPYSILKGLYISRLEFVLLLVSFLLLLLSVTMRKKRLLIAMLASMLLFMGSITLRNYDTDSYEGMTFFSLRKHTAVDFVWKGEHVLLADSTLMADKSTVDYSLSGSWTMKNITHSPQVIGFEEDFENPYMKKRAHFVSFGGKLLVLWSDDWAVEDSLSFRLPVDFLLVTNRQKPEVQSVINSFDVGLLLIDGSVPYYLAEKWENQAQKLHIPYYNIARGAYEISLDE